MIGIASPLTDAAVYARASGKRERAGAAPVYAAAPMRFEGRRALVTGGGSGIGAAIAARLAAEGADVVIGDINEDGAGKVAGEIGATAARLDVTSPDSATEVVAEHGPFSILINNAGMDEFGFFVDTDPGQWERVLAVNLVGVFACTHAVFPGMRDAGYGRIVSIASEAGRVGSKGSAVYSAAKGGVISFMKVMAREGARFGITANSIAPGPIETPLLMGALEFGDLGKKIVETMKAGTQLRRLGKPEEVAAAVAFLASDDASYVTGETLGVSGGLGMV
jgi:2-hydroxycyclohexanecarboxyl-CoA dehydrogenase